MAGSAPQGATWRPTAHLVAALLVASTVCLKASARDCCVGWPAGASDGPAGCVAQTENDSCSFPTLDEQSIRGAIDRAQEGDTVWFGPGAVALNGRVRVNKTLTLRGAKWNVPAGPSPAPAGRATGVPIANPAGRDASVNGWSCSGSADLLEGETRLNQLSNAVLVQNPKPPRLDNVIFEVLASNVAIEGFFLRSARTLKLGGSDETAVQLNGGFSGLAFRNNVVCATARGIVAGGVKAYTGLQAATVQYNWFGVSSAVTFQGSQDAALLDGFTLAHNSIWMLVNGRGVSVEGVSWPLDGPSITHTVSDNSFKLQGGYGVVLRNGNNVNSVVSQNTFQVVNQYSTGYRVVNAMIEVGAAEGYPTSAVIVNNAMLSDCVACNYTYGVRMLNPQGGAGAKIVINNNLFNGSLAKDGDRPGSSIIIDCAGKNFDPKSPALTVDAQYNAFGPADGKTTAAEVAKTVVRGYQGTKEATCNPVTIDYDPWWSTYTGTLGGATSAVPPTGFYPTGQLDCESGSGCGAASLGTCAWATGGAIKCTCQQNSVAGPDGRCVSPCAVDNGGCGDPSSSSCKWAPGDAAATCGCKPGYAKASPDGSGTCQATAPIKLAASTSTLWPPNGKLQAVTLTTNDAMAKSVRFTGVTTNEPVGRGACVRAQIDEATQAKSYLSGVISAPVRLQAARDPSFAPGRLYKITYEVERTNGGTSAGYTLVCVPQTQEKGCSIDDTSAKYPALKC